MPEKIISFSCSTWCRMVIQNVAFHGKLDNNSLRINVDESYCPIRFGHWRFRLDSLAITVKSETKAHFAVGCSLLKSQQQLNGKIVTANTPLCVCSISRTTAFPVIAQLLGPGQSAWNEFNDGSPKFELNFTPISEAGTPKVFDLFVCGVILYEPIGTGTHNCKGCCT